MDISPVYFTFISWSLRITSNSLQKLRSSLKQSRSEISCGHVRRTHSSALCSYRKSHTRIIDELFRTTWSSISHGSWRPRVCALRIVIILRYRIWILSMTISKTYLVRSVRRALFVHDVAKFEFPTSEFCSELHEVSILFDVEKYDDSFGSTATLNTERERERERERDVLFGVHGDIWSRIEWRSVSLMMECIKSTDTNEIRFEKRMDENIMEDIESTTKYWKCCDSTYHGHPLTLTVILWKWFQLNWRRRECNLRFWTVKFEREYKLELVKWRIFWILWVYRRPMFCRIRRALKKSWTTSKHFLKIMNWHIFETLFETGRSKICDWKKLKSWIFKNSKWIEKIFDSIHRQSSDISILQWFVNLISIL